jgi:hypothetical protein
MTRPPSLPYPWSALLDFPEFPDVAAIAEALQVSRRTINYWAKQTVRPSGAARMAIRHLFHSRGLESPF